MRPDAGAFSGIVAWLRYAVLTACNICVGAGVESMLHQLHQILIRFAENFPMLSFKCMQIRFRNAIQNGHGIHGTR